MPPQKVLPTLDGLDSYFIFVSFSQTLHLGLVSIKWQYSMYPESSKHF